MGKKRASASRSGKFLNALLTVVVALFSLAYIAKYGGRELLKFYIRSGIGDCVKIPILCMKPSESITENLVDEGYVAKLVPADFPNVRISLPEGFLGIEEKIRKVYYRSAQRKQANAVIYLLYRPPGFFVELFPRLKSQGVTTDHEFIRRAMNADLEEIASLPDAFFVIMKGVFIPDLGSQHEVTMAEFDLGAKKGFINYNLSGKGHFFDCNIIDNKGYFFKVYIKDSEGILTLPEVLAVISTVGPSESVLSSR
jgi:hypothetical protein